MATFQLKDVLRICRDNKKLLIVLFLAVSIPMLVAATFRPSYYQATAKVFIEHSRKSNLEMSGTLSERAAENPPAPARVNSLLEVVKSRRLIGQVVRALHPDKTEEEFVEEMTRLHERIEARVIPASTIIEIAYSDKNPIYAQKVVKLLAETFQKTAITLIEGNDYTGFYRSQLKLAQKSYIESDGALRDLQSTEGVLSRISEEQKFIEKERESLKSKVTDSDLNMVGLLAKISTLEKQVNKVPEKIISSTESIQNQELIALKDRLNALESEKTNLLTKYNEGDRLVQDKIYEINQLKSRIEAIEPVVESKSVYSINPVRQFLEEDLIRTRASLDEAARTRDESAAKLKIAELQMARLNKRSFDFASLEQAVDASKRAYTMYLSKIVDAKFVDSMNEQFISPVIIVDTPEGPVPVQSKSVPSTALPLAFGAAVAFSAIFMKERLTPRVGNGERAAEFLNLPVLSRMSEVKGKDNGINGRVDA